MNLSNELISQFAKAVNKNTKTSKETTVFGTIVEYDGAQYVRIDGSDLLTPMTSTTNVSDGERVTVLIKNHTATVTGNTTAPAARTTDVEGVSVKLEQTAEGIRAEVSKEVEGLSSTITQTATEIRSEVSNEVEGLNSKITQTASEIRLEVSDEVNGLNSKITQTASEIRSEVSDEVNGLNSTISQTASEIRSEVSDEVNGLNSTISQTATEIRSEVTAVSEDLDGVESTLNSKITQTASEIRSEVTAVSKDLDGVETTLTSKITQNATSITTLVSNQNEFSEFQQTVEGFSFMGTGGTVKIQGGDINLTGAITFSDFDDEVTDEFDSIESTANSASSTAGQALIKANSAEEAADEAKSIAESLDLPDYLHSTYIDSTTIMSPVIVGGAFYAVGETAWTEMSAKGLSIYTGGIDAPKIQLLNENEIVQIIVGAGTYGNGLLDGTFVIRKDTTSASIYYYPTTGATACGFMFDNDRTIYVMGTMVQL